MELLSPVLTKSGWVYGIAAPSSTKNVFFGYPMYFPDPQGTRNIEGQPYTKFLRSNKLSKIQPYRLFSQIDPWANCIPLSEIVKIINPLHILDKWKHKNDIRQLVLEEILATSGILKNTIGIGGSVALGCNNEEADLDIIIYGTRSLIPVLQALETSIIKKDITLMSSETIHGYAERYSTLYQLPYNFVSRIFAQDITKVYVNNKKISFIFAYSYDEYSDIPQELYNEDKRKEVVVYGKVISNISSWLYPRKYVVQENISGVLYTVWSHHWLHKAAVSPGEEVCIKAEKVNSNIIVLSKLQHTLLPI